MKTVLEYVTIVTRNRPDYPAYKPAVRFRLEAGAPAYHHHGETAICTMKEVSEADFDIVDVEAAQVWADKAAAQGLRVVFREFYGDRPVYYDGPQGPWFVRTEV